MILVNTCPSCGETHSVEVDYRDFISYKNGTPAGEAFPYLTESEREQITLHLCSVCQTHKWIPM